MRVAVIIAYCELASRGISTRVAADLVGVPRATAIRKRRVPVAGPTPIPANKIGASDRRQILDVVNSESFVDLPPIQIYAQPLDAGTYLCSISTMYTVLNENKQVKDRRRLARHPARAIPELIATGPGQVFSCYADIGIGAGTTPGFRRPIMQVASRCSSALRLLSSRAGQRPGSTFCAKNSFTNTRSGSRRAARARKSLRRG